MPQKVLIKTVKMIPMSCATGILQPAVDPEKSGSSGKGNHESSESRSKMLFTATAPEKPTTLSNIDRGNRDSK